MRRASFASTLEDLAGANLLVQRRSEGRPTHVQDQSNVWTPEVPVAVRVGTPK